MANSTYRHYRVAQKEHAQSTPQYEMKKAMSKSNCCLFIVIPCILSFILGFCLGKVE